MCMARIAGGNTAHGHTNGAGKDTANPKKTAGEKKKEDATAAKKPRKKAGGTSVKATSGAHKSTGPKNKKKGKQKAKEPEVIAFVQQEDPWRKIRSPYGGRLSQAESLARIESLLDRRATFVRAITPQEAFPEKSPPKTSKKLTEEIILRFWSSHEANSAVLAEKDEGIYLRANACGLEAVNLLPNGEISARLVMLDVSDNELTSCESLGGPNCFLRSLSLRHNRLESLVKANEMKHLVELDISHNALPVLHLDFCAASLRVLRAGHCDLDSAALSALKSCANLEHVDLGSNRLGDPAAIRDAVVCFRKQIRVFRVEGNPIGRIEFDELLAWSKQQCPCLSELDGAAQLHTFSRSPDLADLNLNSEADGIMVQDGASCSCIEGNPCAVPYNCKDWENRVEVARRARAELGYQTTK